MIACCLAGVACLVTQADVALVPYGVPPTPWPENLGNHRARIAVDGAVDAVRVVIPWRLRDRAVPERQIIIRSAAGTDVANVFRLNATREAADVVFEPVDGPGEYLAYYLPFDVRQGSGIDYGSYAPRQDTADADWLARNGLGPGAVGEGLPRARVVEIQARTEFDRFDPMEIVAGEAEVAAMLAQHAGEPYLVFAEDREHPIRMADDIPVRWARSGPSHDLRIAADRGETVAFQLGVFAARERLRDVAVELRDFRGPTAFDPGFRCINLGGTDWLGERFEKHVMVALGKVQALWCLVDVPADARPGLYEGTLTVRADGAPDSRVRLLLEASAETRPDRGDGDPARLSRLRWLDSRLAVDDEVTAPYTPVTLDGSGLHILDRDIGIGPSGLPTSIASRGVELLAAPARFVVRRGGAAFASAEGDRRVLESAPGKVTWDASGAVGPLRYYCVGTLEFDGHMRFRVGLSASEPVDLDDVSLEIPLRPDAVPLMMGMGRKGGARPSSLRWKWDQRNHQDSLWLGGVDAGLQCKLRGSNYERPFVNIYYHRKPLNMPPSWYNGGAGGCDLVEENGAVAVRAYCGPRSLAAHEEQHFDFDLLVTPFHRLDTAAQFAERYYHAAHSPEQVAASGANVVNLHHATEMNPYINYPFLAVDKLRDYVVRAHELGLKVKIYYTVRELTDHLPELWALRSLGREVLADGPGGGYSWLQEHLGGDYTPAWYHRFADSEVDAAVITSGMSRWHSFYVEGLSWLLRNVGIDGLYIDDVAWDRDVMKRVRKVLDRERPGSLIDLHSWNHFNDWAGWASCANLYMENLPYIDRLWFGEGFDYNETTDYWLVEISGIPFGLMGEMLESGGNPWRGMVYGITTRMAYSGDPRPLWHVWDEFGIGKARMIGYWDAACPVRTGRDDVLATVYARDGKALVAIASWAAEPVAVKLRIDWAALGMDPERTRLSAPAIQDFQQAGEWPIDGGITVEPGRGMLLQVGE